MFTSVLILPNHIRHPLLIQTSIGTGANSPDKVATHLTTQFATVKVIGGPKEGCVRSNKELFWRENPRLNERIVTV